MGVSNLPLETVGLMYFAAFGLRCFSKLLQLWPTEVIMSPSAWLALANATEQKIAEALIILLTTAPKNTPRTFGNKINSNSAVKYRRLDGWPKHQSK